MARRWTEKREGGAHLEYGIEESSDCETKQKRRLVENRCVPPRWRKDGVHHEAEKQGSVQQGKHWGVWTRLRARAQLIGADRGLEG